MPLPKNVLVFLAAATLVLATGCSSPKPTAKPGSDHNAADVLFARMMIPHHEQAIEMSTLAATRAESSDVKALASAIKDAQAPEIRLMQTWLKLWGKGNGMSPGKAGHMGHGMPGIMDDKTMKAMEQSHGTSFDRLFLTSMIKHHEGAIEMAKTERSDGRYPAAVSLAGDIIRTQSAEIAQMRDLLKR